MAWPPVYTLKPSTRARHVRLKTSVHKGLEIIVPVRFNQNQIPDILEKNKSWIEKQFIQINALLEKCDPQMLPSEITLLALNQTWKIEYIPSSKNKTLEIFHRPPREMALLGRVHNKALCRKLLKKWLKQVAETYLAGRLQFHAEQMGRSYHGLVIKDQKTRWGSCSAEKIIYLNYKLMFLPAYLVDHIIVHELCHTVYMDHSTKFWKLVALFDAKWKEHSYETRRADKYVPAWVDV